MLVVEVHLPKSGCPAIGVVSHLVTGEHLILHYVNGDWVVASALSNEWFRQAVGVSVRDLPIEIEGELGRRLAAARILHTAGRTYATSSYPDPHVVDISEVV